MARSLATLSHAFAAGLCTCSLSAADLVASAGSSSPELRPGMGGQKVRLTLENRGDKAYSILAGTFVFRLEPSIATASTARPRVTSVRLVGLPGSPLQGSLVSQSDYPAGAGDWMSTIEILSLDQGVWVLPQARWPLCEVELDTTGLPQSATTWNLLMEQSSGGLTLRSFFNVLSGQQAEDAILIEEVPVRAEAVQFRVLDAGAGGGGGVPGMPMGIALGVGGKTLVFEAEAGAAGAPRIEAVDDLSLGAWKPVDASWTLQGSKWRWEMPVDSTASARFYRVAP